MDIALRCGDIAAKNPASMKKKGTRHVFIEMNNKKTQVGGVVISAVSIKGIFACSAIPIKIATECTRSRPLTRCSKSAIL